MPELRKLPMLMTSKTKKVGISRGMVILLIFCQRLAPSISAASYTCWSRPVMAAK